MSLVKKELKEKYATLNAVDNFYYENIFDLKPQTINSKYMKAMKSGYIISKGKSAIFRRALITFGIAFFLVFGSMYLFKGIDSNSGLVESLFFLPKILALVAVVLGIVRLKTLKDIPPFIVLKPEGIVAPDKTIQWNEIEGVFLKTSMEGKKVCDVIVHTKLGIETYNFIGIDEIPEDACIVIGKFWKKHNRIKNDT